MWGEDQDTSAAGPVQQAALLLDLRDWDHATDEQERDLARLARASLRQERTIELRLARMLAVLHAGDVGSLGYSGWDTYVHERVEFSSSWTRDLIRLVESPLDQVKEAASRQVISLAVAVLAPGRITPDQQEAWLLDAIAGRVRPRGDGRRDASNSDVVVGDEADLVEQARELARLFMGWHAPLHMVDAFIIEAWRDRLPASELLARARTDPERPDRLDLRPSWPDVPDPATDLLGPWREPVDLADAARMVDELQDFRRGRLVVVGKAIQLLITTGAHIRLNFATVDDFARGWFGLSSRTLQRYRVAGRDIERHPELEDALKQGISLDKARLVAGIADTRTIDWWVDLARQVGRAELGRATRQARARRTQDVQDAYAPVCERAAADDATENGAPPKVALRGGPPPRPRRHWIFVDPRLPDAAKWFVDTVQLPKATGYRQIRETDDYTCQNPECRRRSLRCQVHHMVPRAIGGTDDPEQLVTLCPACHLRLVHGGLMEVEREGDFLIWTWAAGRQVIMHDPVGGYSSSCM